MRCRFKHVSFNNMNTSGREVVMNSGLSILMAALVIINGNWGGGISHDYFLAMAGINLGLAFAWFMFGRLWDPKEIIKDIEKEIDRATALYDAQKIANQGF